MMPQPWPPPPDIDSIQELVAAADIEGFIADGAPADEYEAEAEEILEAIHHFATQNITELSLIPIIKAIWAKGFSLDENALVQRGAGIAGLAKQIARFFGPEAKPQVRALDSEAT